jgi:hypothetical protein
LELWRRREEQFVRGGNGRGVYLLLLGEEEDWLKGHWAQRTDDGGGGGERMNGRKEKEDKEQMDFSAWLNEGGASSSCPSGGSIQKNSLILWPLF